MLNVAAMLMVAAALLGGIWLAGRGHESAAPESLRAKAIAPAASPTPQSYSLSYNVCAESYGWVRPSLDDERRHLESLGGEFARDASYGFDGAYTSQDGGKTNVWRYGLFWPFVNEPKDEQYALARTGLWTAAPDSSGCDRSSALTLLIDRAVTDMRFAGDIVTITARDMPGHFEYVAYALPLDVHSAGYQLVSERGEFLDGCCS
jgi:hypothetical protein